jgi:hypothetical protein
MQKWVVGKTVGRGQWSVVRRWSDVEQLDDTVLKFFWSGVECATVVGSGDFPELSVGGEGVNSARVADWNIAVDLAVDEKDWDAGRGGGIFGRDLIHVEVVFPTGAEEGDFDERTQHDASHPGAEVEGLSHAVIGDLAEIGERGLDGDGAEIGVGVEGLQELGGTHGFGEGEDAAGILCLEEIEPLMDVVALEQAVGGNQSSAGTVGAGVGEEDGESADEEQLSESEHADAVVAEAVEQKDCVSVRVMRPNFPGAERDVVGSGDGCVGEVGVESVGRVAGSRDFFVGEGTAGGVERAVGDENSADDAEGEIQD